MREARLFRGVISRPVMLWDPSKNVHHVSNSTQANVFMYRCSTGHGQVRQIDLTYFFCGKGTTHDSEQFADHLTSICFSVTITGRGKWHQAPQVCDAKACSGWVTDRPFSSLLTVSVSKGDEYKTRLTYVTVYHH